METLRAVHVIIGRLLSEGKNAFKRKEFHNLKINNRTYYCWKYWTCSIEDPSTNLLLSQIIIASAIDAELSRQYELYVEVEKHSCPIEFFSTLYVLGPIKSFPSNLFIEQNAFVPPQNAFVPPQNAFVPPQNAFVPPQNAFVPPQNERDPNTPKRPLNSFLFYLQERRKEMRAANTVITNREVCNLVGKEWRSLSSNDKSKYEALFKADSLRYAKEMQVYKK